MVTLKSLFFAFFFMLSYRHAFHAGNHADILKHYCLFQAARYFASKNKPLTYIDTHAGAGLYHLNSEAAAKNREYLSGALKTWPESLPVSPKLAPFLTFIRDFTALGVYPGGALITARVLPPKTPLDLFELHPRDFALLEENFAGMPNAHLKCTDGFAGLSALLQPNPRRALILLDPAYEVKDDYARVVATLKTAVKKFATGCYLLWYPCLSRAESATLPQKLKKISPRYLRAELYIKAPAPWGMFGSGMWMINPPYTLKGDLEAVLPQMVTWLQEDHHADFLLEAGEL